LAAEPGLELGLYVTGTHLQPEFGLTVQAIERDGFPIAERIPMLESSDAPAGIAASIANGVRGFGAAFARQRPDLLVVLGDRFEMLAAATAALPFNIPLAHIHGGESTEALIDEAIRHALTKMSHLHFVATDTYARRVAQMGESPERIFVSGAPGLDNVREVELASLDDINRRLRLRLRQPFALVTHHPVTLQPEHSLAEVEELLAALAAEDMDLLFTRPNADTHHRAMLDRMNDFVAGCDRAAMVTNLDTSDYFSLMAAAAVMVGNSSSGIIEAASFRLPVVNIGERQRGRIAGRNVLHCPADRRSIREAIAEARKLDLRDLVNPYGDGGAAERIVAQLRAVKLGPDLLVKRFHDLP
jgi:UDP-N-acetylglucosamine 2-epimerase (non-hydrolysing)/GDP/UDP-N,N'-diacetylbacillosamine 2-epimerase (hydrolysing)